MTKSEKQMIKEYIDHELESTTDEMSDLDIEITPANLSKYLKKEEIDFSEKRAEDWLNSRSWWKDR